MLVNKKVLAALKNALNIGMVADNPQAIPLIESIQPIVPVNDIKLTGTLIALNVDIDLFVGGAVLTDQLVPAYTCPSGKRAYLMHVGNAVTVSWCALAIGEAGSVTNHADISEYTMVTTFVTPLGEIWLEAGESVGLRGNHQAADTAIRVSYVVVEVDW